MNQTYTVVMTDGKEHFLDLETIKKYYLTRQLQETSLIFSPENGGWKTLKAVFNLAEWGERLAFVQRDEAQTAQTSPVSYNSNPPSSSNSNYGYQQSNYYQQPNNYQQSSSNSQNYQYATPNKSGTSGNTILLAVLGIGFALVSLIVVGGLVVSQKVSKVSQDIVKGQETYNKVKEYALPDKEFTDYQTKVKVKIPDSWMMIKTSNPMLTSEYARMVATDGRANSVVMLEIVPIPQNRILDQSRLSDFDNLLGMAFKEIQTRAPQAVETSRMPGVLSGQRAKTLNYTMTKESENYIGSIILAKDSKNFYILECIALKSEYEKAQGDFAFIEKSVVIPSDSILNTSASQNKPSK